MVIRSQNVSWQISQENGYQLEWDLKFGLHPHVLNVLGMQMKSRLHMQSSHVPHTTWLINKQIKLINKQIKLINKQINHMAN